MNTSTTGINLIKKYESCSLSVYADANGYPTVGWGHLLSKSRTYTANKALSDADSKKELVSAGLSSTSSITQSKADQLLTDDIAVAKGKVNAKNEEVYNKMSKNQFDALVSLTFNVPKALSSNDMKTLLGSSSTYSDYGVPFSPSQLEEMAQKVTNAFCFTLAGGKRLRGLVDRRNDEMALFCNGQKYSYNKIPY